MRKIGEVAKLAGISIRTLRYYDETGLLTPKTLESGYRVYNDKDLEHLWQILLCKKMGLPLATISSFINDSNDNREKIMDLQMDIISSKIVDLQQLLSTLKKMKEKGFDEKMLKLQTGIAKIINISEVKSNTDILKCIPNTKLVFICIDEKNEETITIVKELTKTLQSQKIYTIGVFYCYDQTEILRGLFDSEFYMELINAKSLEVIASSITKGGEDDDGISIDIQDFIIATENKNYGFLYSEEFSKDQKFEISPKMDEKISNFNLKCAGNRPSSSLNTIMVFNEVSPETSLEKIFQIVSALTDGYADDVQKLFTVKFNPNLRDTLKLHVVLFTDTIKLDNKSENLDQK